MAKVQLPKSLRLLLRRICARLTSEPDAERHRIELRIGAAFDAEDRMARYVVRLSQALGDLRIAGTYATRPEQPMHERVYFIRLTASHLHEVAILFHPPDEAVPNIEDFIAVIAPDDRETAQRLRHSYMRVRRQLQQPVAVPGKPRLAAELKRIRNQFLHYSNNADDEPPLEKAIRRAADIESAYVIREKTMRAKYADEINNQMVHPWDLDENEWIGAVRALHDQITRLLGPVSDFLHLAEAAYLASRPHGVVRRVDL